MTTNNILGGCGLREYNLCVSTAVSSLAANRGSVLYVVFAAPSTAAVKAATTRE